MGHLHMQYFRWMGGWVTGDWGESFFSNEKIWESFTSKLPTSLRLVAMAWAIAALIGIPAGIIMALKRNSWIDNLGRSVSSISLALPIFWTATLLLVAGIQFLDWDPKTGYGVCPTIRFLETKPATNNLYSRLCRGVTFTLLMTHIGNCFSDRLLFQTN